MKFSISIKMGKTVLLAPSLCPNKDWKLSNSFANSFKSWFAMALISNTICIIYNQMRSIHPTCPQSLSTVLILEINRIGLHRLPPACRHSLSFVAVTRRSLHKVIFLQFSFLEGVAVSGDVEAGGLPTCLEAFSKNFVLEAT